MSTAQIRNLVLNRWRHRASDAPKICLFLGAGADISSGGLTFTAFKRACVEDFSGRLFRVTDPDEVERRFQALFATELTEDDRVLATERIFRSMSELVPSDAYKLLVLLADARAIDAVVTTNFDTMVEAAQEILGINVFQVYAPGLARPFPVPRRPFQGPKVPYIKLHGDLGAGSLVYVTAEELEQPDYDSAIRALLEEIVASHDLIFAGYSGWDPGLARIIGPLVATNRRRVFWCDPRPLVTDAPMHREFRGRPYTYVPVTFDSLLAEIARPVLEHPRHTHHEPVYIPALLDWRIDYCNREYEAEVGHAAVAAGAESLIKRVEVETQLERFLSSAKPLAVVAGPSGFGKSTLGLRLLRTWGRDPLKRVLLLRCRTFTTPDLEFHLAERVGALGVSTRPTLATLERWLESKGARLVVFVDGLNEYSSELEGSVRLFRNITRLAYFLPEHSAIKVIVTLRQETWSALQQFLDRTQLEYCLWSDSALDRSVSAIPIGPLSDRELRSALALFPREAGDFDFDTMLPRALETLRDPYFLAALREARLGSLPGKSDAVLYHQIFEQKLRRSGTRFHPSTLSDGLASLALLCMVRRDDEFRHADAHARSLNDEALRSLKDLGILTEGSGGHLRFTHDRTQEYFQAEGLRLADAPTLDTPDDLSTFLHATEGDGKARAALRMHFILNLDEKFRIIEEVLDRDRAQTGDSSTRDPAMGFAKDLLLDLAGGDPTFLANYVRTTLVTARSSGAVAPRHLRLVVQAAAHLPDEFAISLLSDAEQTGDAFSVTEANIYATDRLVRRLLGNGGAARLLQDEPFRTYFYDARLPVWRRIGRLLGLVSQIGPDNTHPDEYIGFRESAVAALGDVARQGCLDIGHLEEITNFIFHGRDRYLFNATAEGIRRFFSNLDRERFTQILDTLDEGKVLSDADVEGLRPYLSSLDFNLEFQLTNFLYILSAGNDFDATIALWRRTSDAFTNDTAPEFVDFHNAVAVYLYLVNGRPYDDLLDEYTERVFRDLPAVLLYRPGLRRGYQRGYRDEFDMVFEDGFNPVASYPMLRPARWRTTLHFGEYRERVASFREDAAPIFIRWLNRFLSDDRIDEALRILHALSQSAVLWPSEGLWTLRDVVGHPNPAIHRATIRILAETYNRHPVETRLFLRSSGSMLSDTDIAEITVFLDPKVGSRQFEVLQWGRIFSFLLGLPCGRELLVRALRIAFQAPSMEAAVGDIAVALGLYTPTGR